MTMIISTVNKGKHQVAVLENDKVVIPDVQTALDLIVAVNHEHATDRVMINQTALDEKFFDLSNGMAGEILQKFVNYQTKLAIYGDFSAYKSKPLQDFIYESNKGKQIFFVKTKREAIEKLSEVD